MASLARATAGARAMPPLLHQDPASGSEQAWKRFVEEDMAFRVPVDLVRRLERYAHQLSMEQPGLNVTSTWVAAFLLNWALNHQELTDIEPDMLSAALAAEGDRANQVLELLQEKLQELEAFDTQRLLREIAELEQLQGQLNGLCSGLRDSTFDSA
ncbi:MAG: hypothetical protein ACFCVA_01260 [Gammaproteobacteria bacterium]